MATSTNSFEERIARAKEAARLASLAASARGAQQPFAAPSPAAFHAFAPPPPPGAPHAIPDDVKHRIDRLVEFIQRNGAAFEETVRQRERENPHFAFLQPAAPFHDYFVWKKRAVCGDSVGAPLMRPMAMPMAPPPRPHFAPPTPHTALASAVPLPPIAAATSVSPDALLSAMPVGAMANVCKLARKSGLAPYAPIPSELLWQASTLPPVEPARLEIRLAEFYRDLPPSSS